MRASLDGQAAEVEALLDQHPHLIDTMAGLSHYRLVGLGKVVASLIHYRLGLGQAVPA